MSSSSWLLHRAVNNLNVGDCAYISAITCLNPICRHELSQVAVDVYFNAQCQQMLLLVASCSATGIRVLCVAFRSNSLSRNLDFHPALLSTQTGPTQHSPGQHPTPFRGSGG